MSLPFISQASNIGDGVGFVPAPASGETTQSIGGTRRALPQDDGVVCHLDVETVTGRDAKSSSCRARKGDLVLSTDLDA